MYVVVVDFVVKPSWVESFTREMIANARSSRLREPGCRQFDVSSGEDPARIHLYEVYDDRAAFDAHVASPHFRAFDAATADWVDGKTVRTYTRLDP